MGRIVAIVGMVTLLIGGAGGYWAGTHGQLLIPRHAAAADECQTFSQTGKQVCGRFLEYWKANGGLAQQGLPLSDEMQEKSDVDGKTYKMQYFERAVFEAHPENKAPFDVLLSLIGSEKYSRRYPAGLPGGTFPVQEGQTITLDGVNTEGTLQATITKVDTRTSLQNSSKATINPDGIFFIIVLHVTNLGATSNSLSMRSFTLTDSKGRTFDYEGTYNADMLYGAEGIYTTIQPSFSKEIVLVYDVAKDFGSFTLKPRAK